MKARIFDIRRFSTHDGPGIRTTVFFKGCPMSCIWCHNPESQSSDIELVPEHIQCDGVEHSGTRKVGWEVTAEELMEEVIRDQVFMQESGGGVTLSGGEPLMQASFAGIFLKSLKQMGIHTALDTSGFASRESLEIVMPYTDLILYDLKGMDPQNHFHNTGVSNELILSNLEFLAQQGKSVIIRYPVIPELTDSNAEAGLILSFMNGLEGRIREIHLLPYHTMGQSKRSKYGWPLVGKLPLSGDPGRILAIRNLFESHRYLVRVGG